MSDGNDVDTTPSRHRIPVTDVDQVFPAMLDRGPSRGGAVSTGGDLGPVVNQALRDVLGWRPRVEDPKAFVDALTASFRLSIREGHTEAAYVPRGYAVQADLGAVTGGQASLYRRAQVSRTEILRILDGLRTLRNDGDHDDMASYRTIVRGAVQSLVDEMGAAGGPRVQMIDTYFRGLTGERRPGRAVTPDTVGGQLGVLRDRFGLTDANVNTVEEEGTRTAFWTLAEMVLDLQSSWNSHSERFSGASGQGFLGTELILLSRLMEAASDQVDELESVLDSVLIAGSERRTIVLDKNRSLTLDGLLSWLKSFLSDEGRRIAQDTGRDGIVSALAPTAVALVRTFKSALADRVDDDFGPGGHHTLETYGHPVRYLPAGCCEKLPAGMYAARTRVAIASLCRLLMQLAKTAQRIGRFPGVVLLDVAIRPLRDRANVSLVEFRGLNLRLHYLPAFIAEPRDDGDEDCNVDDYGTKGLVRALRGSTSADDDTISGLFHTDEIQGLVPFIGIDELGVVFPAEDVAAAIIDGEIGKIVHAPHPTSYPRLNRLSDPLSRKDFGKASWETIPGRAHFSGVMTAPLLSDVDDSSDDDDDGKPATGGPAAGVPSVKLAGLLQRLTDSRADVVASREAFAARADLLDAELAAAPSWWDDAGEAQAELRRRSREIRKYDGRASNAVQDSTRLTNQVNVAQEIAGAGVDKEPYLELQERVYELYEKPRDGTERVRTLWADLEAARHDLLEKTIALTDATQALVEGTE